MNSKTPKLLIAAAIFLTAQAAQAHPGHAGHGGTVAGFAHPLSGIDHILAMIAVGLLAAQIGGSALWLLPLTFVSLMVAGGLLNLTSAPVPFVEQAIMASVLILGLLIAIGAQMPFKLPISLVGLFAIFHGYAHVAELTPGIALANYAIGFVAATMLLHCTGIALGLAARRVLSAYFFRLSGSAIACCGALLFLGIIKG